MSRNGNRNARVVEEAARTLGARRITWTDGGKHQVVTVELPGGVVARWQVSRSPIDAYKLRGWTRQHIKHALRSAAPGMADPQTVA